MSATEEFISQAEFNRLAATHEAEQGVIAGCLLKPQTIDELGLTPAHFTQEIHRRFFAILLDRHNAGEPVEPASMLTTYLERHGQLAPTRAEQYAIVAGFTEYTPTGAFVREYARTLREHRQRRNAVAIGKQLAETGDVGAAIRALEDHGGAEVDRWTHSATRLADQLADIVSQPPEPGVETGFAALDKFTGGMHPGDLVTMLARPGQGKTALALNVITNANVSAVFFSGEQDAKSVLLRIAASVANVPLQRLRVDGLHDEDHGALARLADWLRESKLTVIDRPSPSLDEINRETRKAIVTTGAKLVVVDYLQRMRDGAEAKWEAVGKNVAGLKHLARQHNVAVFCLVQAGRGCDARDGDDRCPTLADSQHSSAIEQESDVALGLYRARAYEPMSADRSALLRVLKNRHGPRGDVRLHYEGQFVRFENPTANHHQSEWRR